MPNTQNQDEAAGKRLQSDGRDRNAAEPLDAAEDNAGAERYPPAERDDSIAPRSFAQKAGQGAPAEGKR